MLKLAKEQGKQIPQPSERNLKATDFLNDFKGSLKVSSIGKPAVGYIAGQITDIESELQKIDKRAKKQFNLTLSEYPDISKDLFKFSDWEPLKSYTKEDQQNQ